MAKIAGASPKKASTSTSNRSYNNGHASNDGATIEQLAYQFFVERGYAHGYDREDWLRAESIVRARKS